MFDIRLIRTNILRLTQVRFAKVCRVGQPTVSRWEQGVGGPKHVHLRRIRTYAIRNRIEWNDSFLFVPPSKRTRTLASTQKHHPILTTQEAR